MAAGDESPVTVAAILGRRSPTVGRCRTHRHLTQHFVSGFVNMNRRALAGGATPHDTDMTVKRARTDQERADY